MPWVVIRISICRRDVFSRSLNSLKNFLVSRSLVATTSILIMSSIYSTPPYFHRPWVRCIQGTNGDGSENFGKLVADVAYLVSFNRAAVVISQRKVDLILSHTARRGSGIRILPGSILLKGIRFRLKKLMAAPQLHRSFQRYSSLKIRFSIRVRGRLRDCAQKSECRSFWTALFLTFSTLL